MRNSDTGKRSLDRLIPETSPLMQAAWLGSLRYALGNPEILAAYREATGDAYKSPTSLIEQMIDKATGREFAFLESFARWHNEFIWGETEGGEEASGGGGIAPG